MSEAAFQRGYDDERARKGFLDCPYVQDSVEARRWVDGYVKSMQDSSRDHPEKEGKS